MVDINSQAYLRDAVGKSMLSLGEREKKVVIVSANVMASSRVSTFLEKYPDRAFNVGIAEQDMVSFSAGIAHEGFIVYDFTMAPFISMRACEQVRTDVAYNQLNVRLVGTYAGVSGGISGATHWALEDCAIMQGIPGMVVLEPCDPVQTEKMFEASLYHKGPIYIRISIEPMLKIYPEEYNFRIGKADYVREGENGTFICAGVTVKYALEAALRIEHETGRRIGLIDMHTIKPIDKEAVAKAVKTRNIVVAQDHNIIGGLGYSVGTAIAECGGNVKFKILGIPDKFEPIAHAPFLYQKFGYDAEGLYQAMMKFLDD